MVEPNETPLPSTTPEIASAAPTPNRRRRPRHELQDDVPFHAASRLQPERFERALEHARVCARIADDNRAKDILLLDMREATPLVDLLVIATAGSRRQSHAIASEVDQEMKRRGEHKLGMEGSEEGRWNLIDYGDFVVHVFSAEARTYYALEDIWGDAKRLEWRDAPVPAAESSEPESQGQATGA